MKNKNTQKYVLKTKLSEWDSRININIRKRNILWSMSIRRWKMFISQLSTTRVQISHFLRSTFILPSCKCRFIRTELHCIVAHFYIRRANWSISLCLISRTPCSCPRCICPLKWGRCISIRCILSSNWLFYLYTYVIISFLNLAWQYRFFRISSLKTSRNRNRIHSNSTPF